MKRLLVISLALVLPLVLVACGGGEEEAADTGAADTGGAGGGGQTIQVTASDFQFDPPELTADAGEITFELTNDGAAPHALEIEGNGVEESSEVIDGGDSTSLTVTLEDGTYEIYCPVGDHADRGMVGTLTVGHGGGSTTHDDTTSGGTDTDGDTGETDTDDSGGSGSNTGSDDATNY